MRIYPDSLKQQLEILIAGMVLAVSLVLPLFPAPVSALNGTDFNPSHIIDDFVFTNANTMSAQDIQNFLNAKLPSCDTNGAISTSYYYNSATGQVGHSSFSGASWVTTSRQQYGQYYDSYNHTTIAATPYVCLKSYIENTSTGQNNLQNPSASIPGSISAAQIIYNSAHTYQINPQVLLVTLQKEEGLLTDDWPWTNEYTEAMGYNCPDTPSGPACNGFAGFFQQVDAAAKQYRNYLTNPNNFNYVVGSNNQVKYSPSCNAPAITIQNQATAALYDYTPYRPNANVLSHTNETGSSNGPGGAVTPYDSCAAYGNRNFWWYFNTWFGSSFVPTFYSQYVSQSPYPILDSGTTATLFFEFKNVGTGFWKDDASNFPGYYPVHLATTFPINRRSAFQGGGWSNYARPAGNFSAVYEADGVTLSSDQHTVQPGQIAKFSFTAYANPSLPGGVYREFFQPILEGAPGYTWNMGAWAYLDIGINMPNYQASYFSQSAYPTLSVGGSTTAYFQFKNTGSAIWYDDTSIWPGKLPVHLATTWPINRSSIFNTGWSNAARPNLTFTKVFNSDGTTLSNNQHAVQPGQIAEFDFPITVPNGTAPGLYKEHFQPIIEGAPGYTWNMGGDVWLGVTVN